MGKRTKVPAADKPKRKAKAKPSAPVPVDVDIADRLRAEFEELGKLTDIIDKTIASGEAAPALVRERASMARAKVQLSGELRQLERHARTAVEAMTPEERVGALFTWIEQLPAAHLAELRRRLGELDEGGSILAL